jgi:hypothetical protein
VSPEELKPLLETASRYLSAVPERETGLALTRIAEVRAEFAELPPAEEAMRLASARARLLQARSYVYAGNPEAAEVILDDATTRLRGVSAAAATAVLAEIADVRTEQAVADLDRALRTAQTHIPTSPPLAAVALKRFADRAEEARATLPADILDHYMARGVELTTLLAESIKSRALAAATPALVELESTLATNPYAGADQHRAYSLTDHLRRLKHTVLTAIAPLPPADPDVRSIHTRIQAADRILTRVSATWGKATAVEPVACDWPAILAATAGWSQERPTPGLLAEPDLPRTRAAVALTRHLLRRFDLPPADRAAAVALHTAASSTLAKAYAHVLDEAEKLPTPLRGSELARPALLGLSAEYALAGTPKLAPLAARARDLDARWRSEAAARTRHQVHDTLAAEAEAAWPRIVAALNPAPFAPGTPAGRTVLLAGVYNRATYDFRDEDFAMRVDGIPVAGSYEPQILRALEHAWYDLRMDVGDHTPWDLVAITEGPGTITERTVVTLLADGTEIAQHEEWRQTTGVRLRVIALRAGPVAAGPL